MTQRAEDRGKIADFGLRIADLKKSRQETGGIRN
jgi:hypothetical protein